ncbi:response regulator [Salinimicrobium sp. GXAS 041]|uniref:response regulator n=1 Tax=Salinimicrobium sp. GXAS 041 TaxID=3400806 RepID=UPI003C77755C
MDFKVAIVDDDAVVLFLHEVLVKRSCLPPVVFSCKNACDAIKELESKNVDSTPFLLLLDINMPVMNGWEFLDAIQEKYYKENIIVALVTSSINMQDRKTAERYSQVIHYFEKPLTTESLNYLCEKVKSLLLNKD